MSKLFLCFAMATAFYSCISQSEHDKIVAEKDAILKETERLKQELEDIKFGAPNLLADGKSLFDAKDFTQARQKFEMLLAKHPAMPQSIEAKNYLSILDEEELWNNVSSSDDISYSEIYIARYPKGKYFANSVSRHNDLKAANMKKAYTNAAMWNSSSKWKKFLEDYPEHPEAKNIRKTIIRLEVDEITGDVKTGKMPEFNQNTSGYSANSSVTITNDTGCELTVRYSGPDAEMIIIPENGTKTMHVSSGDYQIAATACGMNYASTENLHGKYTSKFYIVTSHIN